MRAILLSVQPKWLEKILNGEKTIEIRKSMPKCDLPVDVYLYCAYGDGLIDYRDEVLPNHIVSKITKGREFANTVNGKVVAKFTLRKVSKIEIISNDVFHLMPPSNGRFLVDSCLTQQQVHDYLANKNGYAWHITDLVVFDKPMELGKFRHITKGHKKNNGKWAYVNCIVTRPPQSYMYVEVEND